MLECTKYATYIYSTYLRQWMNIKPQKSRYMLQTCPLTSLFFHFPLLLLKSIRVKCQDNQRLNRFTTMTIFSASYIKTIKWTLYFRVSTIEVPPNIYVASLRVIDFIVSCHHQKSLGSSK